MLRKGKLFDRQQRAINATLFIRYLQNAVEDYARALETDDKLWKNFRKRMNSVCKHCEVPV